nr:hypothetical protein [Tanacetum cinerariifolium]
MNSNVMTPRSTNVVFHRISFGIQKRSATQLIALLLSTTMQIIRPRVQGLCGVMTVGRGEECGMAREAGKLGKKGLQGFGGKDCSVQYFENVGVTGVEV